MKRSEAIQAIGKVLTYGANGFPPDKRHAYKKKSLADIILTELESLGMLPPDTKATPEDFSNLGFTQDFLDEHDFSVSKWEPEDD
jgi:hypothetical protein